MIAALEVCLGALLGVALGDLIGKFIRFDIDEHEKDEQIKALKKTLEDERRQHKAMEDFLQANGDCWFESYIRKI